MTREERLKAILEHPAYVRADLDLDWIGSNEMRGAPAAGVHEAAERVRAPERAVDDRHVRERTDL